MLTNVRVRFAPSPTGPLHIGGVRTALFNYLFAKKYNGKFILRIEDTDRKRYVANAEQYIKDSLDWCSIHYDEGPGKNEKYGSYRQSERKEIYKKYVQELIDRGSAYYAFDTREQLEKQRIECLAGKNNFVYNSKNRKEGKLVNSLVLTKEEVRTRIDSGEKFVVRFKTPESRSILLEDQVRGSIKVNSDTLDDKILFKSDGMPTYHLANVVDDHLMKISHVIRGEEWLPSLALHTLLYESLDWSIPKFAHLPLILKPSGKGKLSKRDGDQMGFPVFPLSYSDEKTGETLRGYKEDGYFADAFVNMLCLLGWNSGTEQEIFSIDELVDAFDLHKVNKSGSRFDPKKSNWFNQQYLQQKSDSELADLFTQVLSEKKIKKPKKYIEKIVSLTKERAVFVNDFWKLNHYFFEAPQQYHEKSIRRLGTSENKGLMNDVFEVISTLKDITSSSIEKTIKGWIEKKELSIGKIMQLLRLAIVGEMKGPDLFEIMGLLEKEVILRRIRNLIDELP